MSANSVAMAPPGRKKVARGKDPATAGDAASGYGQNTSSPAGAKKGPWPVVPLSELAADERNSVTDGPFGSKLKTEHYTAAGPRVIRLKNIGDAEFVDAKAHISDAHFSTLQKHRAFAGDIVIAALGENPPRSCLVPESLGPAIVKADCIRFKAGPRVLPKFLNYVLNAPDLRRHAKGIIHGVGRPRLNLGEIKALPIPVPSLPEQQQIVAEIEKQFTRLEAGVAALRRVQANLKRYRAAVLKAACEGRLVPAEAELAKAENRKFETGEELLARILTERRTKWEADQLSKFVAEGRSPKGDGWKARYKEPQAPDTTSLPVLPDGWVWVELGQLAWSVKDGPHYSPKYASEGVPFISGGNIRPSGVDFDNAKCITADLHAELSKRCKPEVGDILYTKGGTTGIARVNTYPVEFNVWVHVAVLKLVDSVRRFYVQHALNSPLCYTQAQKFTHGVGNQDLGLTRMIHITVALPPLAEQTRIVAEVERRLSIAEELEAVVSANLQRAIRLRQSILQKAFAGFICQL